MLNRVPPNSLKKWRENRKANRKLRSNSDFYSGVGERDNKELRSPVRSKSPKRLRDARRRMRGGALIEDDNDSVPSRGGLSRRRRSPSLPSIEPSSAGVAAAYRYSAPLENIGQAAAKMSYPRRTATPPYSSTPQTTAVGESLDALDMIVSREQPGAAAVVPDRRNYNGGRGDELAKQIIQQMQYMAMELKAERELRHQMQLQVMDIKHQNDALSTRTAAYEASMKENSRESSKISAKVQGLEMSLSPRVTSLGNEVALLKKTDSRFSELKLENHVLQKTIESITSRLNTVASELRSVKLSLETRSTAESPLEEDDKQSPTLIDRMQDQRIEHIQRALEDVSQETKNNSERTKYQEESIKEISRHYKELTENRIKDIKLEFQKLLGSERSEFEQKQTATVSRVNQLQGLIAQSHQHANIQANALRISIDGEMAKDAKENAATLLSLDAKLRETRTAFEESFRTLSHSISSIKKDGERLGAVQNALISLDASYRESVSKIEQSRASDKKNEAKWRKELIQNTRQRFKAGDKANRQLTTEFSRLKEQARSALEKSQKDTATLAKVYMTESRRFDRRISTISRHASTMSVANVLEDIVAKVESKDLHTQICGIRGDVASSEKRIHSAESSINSNSSDIKKSNEKLAGTLARVSAIETKLALHEQKLQSHSQELAVLRQKIETEQSARKAADSLLTMNERENAVRSYIADLSGQIAIESLRGDVETEQKRAKTAESKLAEDARETSVKACLESISHATTLNALESRVDEQARQEETQAIYGWMEAITLQVEAKALQNELKNTRNAMERRNKEAQERALNMELQSYLDDIKATVTEEVARKTRESDRKKAADLARKRSEERALAQYISDLTASVEIQSQLKTLSETHAKEVAQAKIAYQEHAISIRSEVKKLNARSQEQVIAQYISDLTASVEIQSQLKTLSDAHAKGVVEANTMYQGQAASVQSEMKKMALKQREESAKYQVRSCMDDLLNQVCSNVALQGQRTIEEDLKSFAKKAFGEVKKSNEKALDTLRATMKTEIGRIKMDNAVSEWYGSLLTRIEEAQLMQSNSYEELRLAKIEQRIADLDAARVSNQGIFKEATKVVSHLRNNVEEVMMRDSVAGYVQDLIAEVCLRHDCAQLRIDVSKNQEKLQGEITKLQVSQQRDEKVRKTTEAVVEYLRDKVEVTMMNDSIAGYVGDLIAQTELEIERKELEQKTSSRLAGFDSSIKDLISRVSALREASESKQKMAAETKSKDSSKEAIDKMEETLRNVSQDVKALKEQLAKISDDAKKADDTKGQESEKKKTRSKEDEDELEKTIQDLYETTQMAMQEVQKIEELKRDQIAISNQTAKIESELAELKKICGNGEAKQQGSGQGESASVTDDDLKVLKNIISDINKSLSEYSKGQQILEKRVKDHELVLKTYFNDGAQG